MPPLCEPWMNDGRYRVQRANSIAQRPASARHAPVYCRLRVSGGLMAALRVCFGICLATSFLFSVRPAAAEVYPLIIKGKVTMPDGSPPPFAAGIERVCSDSQGSAPGPLTDKKGEYLWRMDVDPLRTR